VTSSSDRQLGFSDKHRSVRRPPLWVAVVVCVLAIVGIQRYYMSRLSGSEGVN
jgi:hypothetical protein